MINNLNKSIHNFHVKCTEYLSNPWEGQRKPTGAFKYAVIFPLFFATLMAAFTLPWRWVATDQISHRLKKTADKAHEASSLISPSTPRSSQGVFPPQEPGASPPKPRKTDPIDQTKQKEAQAARKDVTGCDHQLKTIPAFARSTLEDHPFESLFPERPIETNVTDERGNAVGFQQFQVNCNGGEIAFNDKLNCYEGPQIARYSTEGTRYGALLSRIQLTPEMGKKLPLLPKEIAGREITDAFITVWGNLPGKQEQAGGGEHFMFRPQALVGTIPNGYGRLEKGLYPIQIGAFTDQNGGLLPNRDPEAHDFRTALPLNDGILKDGIQERRYDCHGENDDPAENVYDNVYATSTMGTFDLEEGRPVHAFTAVALYDSPDTEGSQFPKVSKTMISYNVMLSDKLTEELAPVFHTAKNVQALLQALQNHSKKPELTPPEVSSVQRTAAVLTAVLSS